MNTGNNNPSDSQQQPSWQHPSLNHRTRLTSHNSERLGTSASTPGFGSKSSINQISTKKMMDNEIEGVQFNRKRMNSTISNSSGGRSMDTPSKFGDQVILQFSFIRRSPYSYILCNCNIIKLDLYVLFPNNSIVVNDISRLTYIEKQYYESSLAQLRH